MTTAGPRDPWKPFASRLASSLDRGAAPADVWARRSGTLLKLDITGFTRLSERLAQAERTGAEELNAVLTAVFTDLVDDVDRHGGDVLHFGGDALAVWFEGEGHRARATAAARDAHASLRSRPAASTPAGPVRLRASAGLASGEVLFGVVGHDLRQLVALGPTVTATMRAEAAAAPGRTVAAPVEGATDELVAGLRPARAGAGRRAVPPVIRSLLPDGVGAGEHGRAAVGFVGLTGLDTLLDVGRGDDAAARVGHLVSAVETACSQTGVVWSGADLAPDGFVLLLYAGTPVATEHDADRLLRALHAILAHHPEARAGAHLGRIFTGVLGAPSRHCWTALGDTVNVAARLMSQAAPGTALVSATLVEAAGTVMLGPRTWLSLKGKRGQLEVAALDAQVPLATIETGDDDAHAGRQAVPLVGRDAEIARIADVLRGSAAGIRRGLLLVGPAGIGKSRVLAEAMRLTSDDGRTVMRAAATPLDDAAAYAALRPALRSALGTDVRTWRRLAGEDASLVPLLALPLGVTVPDTPESRDLDPALVAAARDRLLARVLVAACGRLVVVAEDGQWLDRGSMGLLDALQSGPADQPTAVLVALRDPPGTGTSPSSWPADLSRWATLVLDPLDRATTRRLAVAASGEHALDDLRLDALVAEAGGNPLFAQELARLSVAEGDVSAGALPESVEDVIAARLGRLPAASRLLLRESAVGGECRTDVMAQALDRPELEERRGWRGVGEFVSIALDDGGRARVRFQHDLYRRAAYEGLPVRRRRELHARFADLLEERGEEPAVVSAHAESAGQHDRAAALARTAAEAAASAGAWGDALRLWDRAWTCGLRAGRPDTWLAAVAERRGEAADLVGRYELAERALSEAQRRDPAAPVAVRTRRAVARAAVVERQGRYRAALRILTSAERALPRGPDDPSWPSIALRRSSVLYRLGRLRESLALASQLADRRGTRRDDRARALVRVEMCASELGLPDAEALGERALRAFRGVRADRDLAALLGNLGVTDWEANDWGSALERYREAEQAYRRAGDVVGAAIAANNAAELLGEQGRSEEAVPAFTDALRAFRASGHAFGAACVLSSLGRIAAHAGEWDRAAELLTEAEAEFDRLESPVLATDARIRQAELALLRGSPDVGERLAAAEAAVRSVDAGVAARATLARLSGLASWARGDGAAAVAELQGALADACDAESLHEQVLCLDALLAVGGGNPAERQTWRTRRDEGAAQLGLVRFPPLPRRVGSA